MVNPDLTVIYYTNNQEHVTLETRVQKYLLDILGDTPLISVSQKPIDFGHNICVGEVGSSSQNAFRQLQIGAQAAETKFVCPAEADYLFPSEYFEYIPKREDTFYMALPVWVLFAQRGKAKVYCRKREGSEAAMVVGRQTLIDRVDKILDGRGTWGMLDVDGVRMPYLLDRRRVRREVFDLDPPPITFKTDRNMHRRCPHLVETRTRELPHWGHSHDLLQRFLV